MERARGGSLPELEVLIQASEKMLVLAQTGEWEQVAALEIERRQRLEELLGGLGQEQRERNAAQLRQVMERMLELDRQLIQLGQQARADAAQSLRQSQSARRATAAYEQNNTL